MNKLKPTIKHEVKKPEDKPMSFVEIMRRIVRVNPKELKLPKR